MSVVGLSLAAALAVMVVTWAISVPMRDASIADIAWGICSAAIAWTAFVAGEGADRSLLIAIAVTVWGLRLSAHIAARHDGEDRRYREMRERQGDAFALRSLYRVFAVQAVIAVVICAPVLAASIDGSPDEIGLVEIAGLAIFLIGFGFEAISDRQLTRFRADSANEGEVMDSGLWRYSRHPNYFGETVIWWGLWIVSLGCGSAWWAVVGPIAITFLLLKVSGVGLTEKTISDRRPGYRSYIERTSAFMPLPPRSG